MLVLLVAEDHCVPLHVELRLESLEAETLDVPVQPVYPSQPLPDPLDTRGVVGDGPQVCSAEHTAHLVLGTRVDQLFKGQHLSDPFAGVGPKPASLVGFGVDPFVGGVDKPVAAGYWWWRKALLLLLLL